ncbi:MAG TPA: DUF3152 domain-containing protein [Pseudonocardiaceae bacterium]
MRKAAGAKPREVAVRAVEESAVRRLTQTAESLRAEQRYRSGQRRTAAKPLTASWRPEVEDEPERRRKRGIGRVLSTYGWRVYAVPVLVVLSVLVLLNTTHKRSNEPVGAAGITAEQAGLPTVTEQGAVPVNAGTGTAVLPTGGTYPQSGAGTWRILPGTGPIVGKQGAAKVYHYQVRVEDGIDPSYYQGDDAFVSAVQSTLSDPRSWIAAGTFQLQRVDATFAKPDFTIDLTTPNTDHRPDLCGFEIGFEGSCWVLPTHQVIINIARWVRGALAFNGDLGLYRQYAVNHEVGHAFGNHHVGCATNGGLAPVMMEQSFGVADDYVYDVNNAEPSNRGNVQRDGKVCKVNAWPYPQGPGFPATAPPAATN